MTRVKVSEATGPVLDWMVAKAEGLAYRNDEKYGPMCFRPSTVKGVVHWDSKPLPYSTDWSQGGPIIEREQFSVYPFFTDGRIGGWSACNPHSLKYDENGGFIEGSDHAQDGPTPLIVAMRCFVASKLGDEVDVPEELL